MADKQAGTILVVDDTESSRYLVCRSLRAARFDVQEAETGQEALRLVRDLPDLVVLDVRLPDLSGFQVCERIKADPATASIPVLLLSATLVDGENRTRGFEGGADGYLTPPVEPRELIAHVGALLRSRRAERELEAFVHSVSHDLRAPLRVIDGFSDELLRGYSGQLDERGRHFLTRIRAGTQRMGQMIDDLLRLSRITRSDMARERVDLSAVAESVVSDLRELNPDREVTFVIQPGLFAVANPALARVVLENLLGNAHKFTAKAAQATIEFGWNDRDRAGFYVRDNGAGFDMAHAGKLFGAFQRLHSEREFPGTGVGLATVQRIVHRHGGRVWAEGSPGKGATFFFTLPGADMA